LSTEIERFYYYDYSETIPLKEQPGSSQHPEKNTGKPREPKEAHRIASNQDKRRFPDQQSQGLP
jgi:hypothetical protein